MADDNTKLANLMLAFELDRLSKAAGWGVSSLASLPGFVRTNLVPNSPGLNSKEGWRFWWLRYMFQPAVQGALPTCTPVHLNVAVGYGRRLSRAEGTSRFAGFA